MKKIYHQTQSLYKLERVSIIHKTKLSNRYVAKYILSWTFCGKERTIEKDRYGNYYLNGFMCNCLDILNYLQSPNQNDVEFGKIAAERRIDDNKKWFEGKTDDELEELKIKEEQIIKTTKKRVYCRYFIFYAIIYTYWGRIFCNIDNINICLVLAVWRMELV